MNSITTKMYENTNGTTNGLWIDNIMPKKKTHNKRNKCGISGVSLCVCVYLTLVRDFILLL